jgi:hypothetical protein
MDPLIEPSTVVVDVDVTIQVAHNPQTIKINDKIKIALDIKVSSLLSS